MLLRILLSFALGAVLTLLITSVNYRRDHMKDTRAAFIDAVREVAKRSAELWSASFDSERVAHLQGAVTYLQHILPYSLACFSKEEQKSLRGQFADLVDVSMGREDFSEDNHQIDLRRVLHAQTLCASMMAEYSSISMERMGLAQLVIASTRDWRLKASRLIGSARGGQ